MQLHPSPWPAAWWLLLVPLHHLLPPNLHSGSPCPMNVPRSHLLCAQIPGWKTCKMDTMNIIRYSAWADLCVANYHEQGENREQWPRYRPSLIEGKGIQHRLLRRCRALPSWKDGEWRISQGNQTRFPDISPSQAKETGLPVHYVWGQFIFKMLWQYGPTAS